MNLITCVFTERLTPRGGSPEQQCLPLFTPSLAESFRRHRRTLHTFFNFCRSRGWLSREADLLEGIGKRKEAQADIEVFTPSELRRILHAATPKAATCIVLQAFAGVRSEELLRLTWTDLERRKGFIEITARKAKTAQRRLIPILPNLEQWRDDASRASQRVWPHSKPFLFEAMRDASAKAKVVWRANGLRHSFITYRLAQAASFTSATRITAARKNAASSKSASATAHITMSSRTSRAAFCTRTMSGRSPSLNPRPGPKGGRAVAGLLQYCQGLPWVFCILW
jgi:integrase